MGSASSKAARTGSAVRKYPTRTPSTSLSPLPGQSTSPSAAEPDAIRPAAKRQTPPRERKDPAIELDGTDPQYAASLRSLGAVQPNPMYSHSSTFHRTASPRTDQPPFPDVTSHPALQILRSRDQLAAAADREFVEAGRQEHVGRQFLDIFTIRQILMLRDEKNTPPPEIEQRLGLQPGVVQRLGKTGVVGLVGHSDG